MITRKSTLKILFLAVLYVLNMDILHAKSIRKEHLRLHNSHLSKRLFPLGIQ